MRKANILFCRPAYDAGAAQSTVAAGAGPCCRHRWRTTILSTGIRGYLSGYAICITGWVITRRLAALGTKRHGVREVTLMPPAGRAHASHALWQRRAVPDAGPRGFRGNATQLRPGVRGNPASNVPFSAPLPERRRFSGNGGKTGGALQGRLSLSAVGGQWAASCHQAP